jgi:hypothetical protein
LIENTANRTPYDHLHAAVADDINNYITDMEQAGQDQLVASGLLPVDGPWSQLEALGFVPGPPVADDDLFRHVTLPAGWYRQAHEHQMWSHLYDSRGLQRVAVFYKAAFYDRKAHCRLVDPGQALAVEHFDRRDEALPEQYPRLTTAERVSFWAYLVGVNADWLAGQLASTNRADQREVYVTRVRTAADELAHALADLVHEVPAVEASARQASAACERLLECVDHERWPLLDTTRLELDQAARALRTAHRASTPTGA